MATDLLLSPGARLVHVGAHKTGTTAVQGAFSQASDRLAEHGVSYFGPIPGKTYLEGALAISGRKSQLGKAVPSMERWTALTADVAAEGERRVLVSSAFFGDGDEGVAARVVEGFGGSRVYPVITLRPLTKVMPSQWQQYVQNGLRMPYADWLDGELNKPREEAPTPTFWRRHRHDELVARWAAAAGAGNVIAVVVDDSDRFMLLRTFEEMLGLPSGFLELDQSAENRSLTLGEVELIRLINEEFTRRNWPEKVYASLMKGGVLRQLKVGHQPGPEETRVTTPAWALKRAAEIDTEIAANIAALGVRVVGDISSLSGQPADAARMGADSPQAAPMVPPAAAAQAVLGAMIGSKVPEQVIAAKAVKKPAKKAVVKKKPVRLEDMVVRDLDYKTLVRVLVARAKRRARRTFNLRR
jgi:hypothetical protein